MKYTRLIIAVWTLSCVAAGCARQEVSVPAEGMKVVMDVSQVRITGFAQDASGYIWMSTFQDGVFRYNGQSYLHYSATEKGGTGISADLINDMMTDASGTLWLGTQKGVDRYNAETGCFDHIEIDDVNQYVMQLFLYPDNSVGITTRRGKFKYDPQSESFKEQQHLSGIEQVTASSSLSATGFLDRQGNVWTAQTQGGWKISPADAVPQNGTGQQNTTDQQYDNVSRNDFDTWHVYEATGVFYQRPQVQYLAEGRMLVSERGQPASVVETLADGSMKMLYQTESQEQMYLVAADAAGNLWAAADGGAILYAAKPAVTSASTRISSAQDKKTSASTPQTSAQNLRNAQKVRLTPNGLRAPVDLSYATIVRTLKDGRILFLLTDNHPLILDPASHTLSDLCPDEEKRQIYYSSMLEDSEGNVWMGTGDWGLFCYSKQNGTAQKIEELGNSAVYNIFQDNSGRVFVNTAEGVYAVQGKNVSIVWRDLSEYRTVRPMYQRDGNVILVLASGNVINLSSHAQSENGKIDAPVNVVITEKGNVLADYRTDMLQKRPMRLTLRAGSMNDLNMHLSVVEYSGSCIYDYSYEVNHFHGGMRQSVNNPTIPLYGLDYGQNTITFNIQSTNDLSESGRYQVKLYIRRPGYLLATYAGIGMLLIILSGAMIVLRRRKRDAAKERHEREMQEEINMKNIDFFANISHEFRAPLTLINAAVGSLDSKEPEQERMVGVIKRNTNRMLKLVGQMLDFNKLDHDMLRLAVREEEVTAIINRVAESFSAGAGQKSISFIVEGADAPFKGWIDSDKLEKVMYNLCSNAMKFTPPGGTITIHVEHDEKQMSLSVTDTGIGLQEDRIDTIFNRFAQLESVKKSGGTGIGLYYAKSLVGLHHGTIGAENCYVEGKVSGARFFFSLPLAREVYTEDELNPQQDTFVALDPIVQQNEFTSAPATVDLQADKPTVLLIDDDYEFIYFLRSVLSEEYNVQFRFDAMGGYNIIDQVKPDVIISDMMMIDVDGLQLCRMIKENISMCHIPVIMLTGRSTVEDQINSLNVGADAYVIKPFNPDYLKALIRSMIENRTRIRSLLTTSVSTATVASASKPQGQEEAPEESGQKVLDLLGPKDRAFMDALFELMDRNLDNGELDIDSLASELGVSRSKFYYKLKDLTGQTPNEFFTTYKLNRAVKLIEEGKYKISAIANMVGFNSSSHFAQLFRKRFGVLPSQWGQTPSTNEPDTDEEV